MPHLFRLSLIAVLGVALFSTGCASSKTQREINSLNAQVAVITDELVRIDDGLRDVRSSIQSSPARVSAPTGMPQAAHVAIGSVYRTPSGFELPALSIQQALKNAGYYNGSVDGKIGSQTKTSIKAFQKDHDLKADGVVGRQTWSKLKVYLNGPVK